MRMVWVRWSLMALGGALIATGCGDDDGPEPGVDAGPPPAEGDAGPPAETDGGAAEDAGPPAPLELPPLESLSAGWNELLPGGETVCSRGSEFAFFVHPGTVDRVVIDFIGGGACWDATTCSFADAIFNDSVEPVRRAVARGEAVGIYDRENEENPFRDWTHVIIPYCTGDVHWGNASQTYNEGVPGEVSIEHKGAVNARVVLDWIYENFATPEQFFVTGCSAGSYGSLAWSAYVMNEYPGVPVVQFGDSGAGVITESFFRDSFPVWNATEVIPDWIEGLDPEEIDIFELELADLYLRLAAANPDAVLSQYNTTFDDNQTFYYSAMGGEGGAEGWSERMLASTSRIVEGATNYRNFQAPGEQHCIIVQENFYEVESNGVRLVEWIQDLVDGEEVPNVTCSDCSRATPGTEE